VAPGPRLCPLGCSWLDVANIGEAESAARSNTRKGKISHSFAEDSDFHKPLGVAAARKFYGANNPEVKRFAPLPFNRFAIWEGWRSVKPHAPPRWAGTVRKRWVKCPLREPNVVTAGNAGDLLRLKMQMAASHPDRGGTSEAFINARARYEDAKRHAGKLWKQQPRHTPTAYQHAKHYHRLDDGAVKVEVSDHCFVSVSAIESLGISIRPRAARYFHLNCNNVNAA
jgi:hypothetical protein